MLKVDPAKRRISLGLKQLQPHPWELVGEKYKTGERVHGTVTRVADFGAFVELEKGVEGLIHLSEMSWSKKVRKPCDVVKPGDQVEVVILGVNQAERRISLGLKQALGDPWADVAAEIPGGRRGRRSGGQPDEVRRVRAACRGRRRHDPRRRHHARRSASIIRRTCCRAGQMVSAQVLEVDAERRRLRLGMKQLLPTSLDEYIAEHKEGDVVTGRMTDVSGGRAKVELGEGIQVSCKIAGAETGRDGRAGRRPPAPTSVRCLPCCRPSGRAARRAVRASRNASRPAPGRFAASASSSWTPAARRSKSS